ncbi:MAG: rod shape-determining protein [Lachnospiraceae bacterium]|nr:rod shape-determining protein [Lachnospiraceae bacterium]
MAELGRCPEHYIFGLDIGTRSIVGTVGYRESEKKFVVVAQVVEMHETRSMLDGQIHDIAKVAESIQNVRQKLEEMIGFRLEEVCIAAAGRVLKTVNVRVDYDLEDEVVIDTEHLRTLELLGIEKAYDSFKGRKKKEGFRMHCVGSTIVHYYLNDYLMLSLEGHKGSKISAELIATFLPDEVIESLYAAVERANLKVANLTLEPIAASEVAIPINYRLLNIALVDVGAGTSDISITKDGSIIGYGMIPYAGDEFTEKIAKRYLVDFATAEEIKLACFSQEEVTYKDIMGLENTVPAKDILDGLSKTVERITKNVADKIKELNGGSSVSAVFIVGGGGKLPNFAENLAKFLKLPKERVAVRGEEVLGSVEFLQKDVKKDSTLVTPVGICLSYYEKNNNFILVSVNGRQVKLYDNGKLSVMDAAMQIGFPKENLFPKRGKELIYWLNGEKRMLRGEAGEAAQITINGKHGNFNSSINGEDIIEIIPSTEGKDASGEIGKLVEFKRKDTLTFTVNDRMVKCPRMVKVNGNVVLDTYSLQENDKIEILDYYFMEELLEFMDLGVPKEFFINHKEGDWDDRIYDESIVECVWYEEDNSNEIKDVQELIESMQDSETTETDRKKNQEQNLTLDEPNKKAKSITVTVNNETVVLSGKDNYIFVDILDFYPFDTSVAAGNTVVTKVNGIEGSFSTPISDGDSIELGWES